MEKPAAFHRRNRETFVSRPRKSLRVKLPRNNRIHSIHFSLHPFRTREGLRPCCEARLREQMCFGVRVRATATKAASQLAPRVSVAEVGRWALGGLWGGYVLLVCVERMRRILFRVAQIGDDSECRCSSSSIRKSS